MCLRRVREGGREGRRKRKGVWGRERNTALLGSKSIYYYNSEDWKRETQSLQCATDQRRVRFEILVRYYSEVILRFNNTGFVV